MKPKLKRLLSTASALVVGTAVGIPVYSMMSASAAVPVVQQDSVQLNGPTGRAILKLHADTCFKASEVGVAARDLANDAWSDYPGSVHSVNVCPEGYTYSSDAPNTNFKPGHTYSVFGFYQTADGVWHNFPAQNLAIPSATPPPSPTPSSPSPVPTPAPTSPTPSTPPTSSPPGTPTPGVSSGPTGVPGTWSKVAFDDEFNGTTLNPVWQPGWFGSGITPPVNGSSDLNCYDSSQVTVSGGVLHLAAVPKNETCGGVSKQYASGLVSSNPATHNGFQFTYGVVEFRVYVPAASNGSVGDWPAVWTDGQSWPADGEIDAMEGLGGPACWNTHITGNQSPAPQCPQGRWAAGWHTYAVDWEPGSVTAYYDGVNVGSRAYSGSSANYLILNNAVASPVVAPADMQVDYVRVWQH